MFCALLGHTGERLQDHWSSGFESGTTIDCVSLIYWGKISTHKFTHHANMSV